MCIFCIEVTLVSGTSSPNVHKVWKKDPLNNKVMHSACKAKVLQMWQKFYLCTGYKILLRASTARYKRATSVLCRSSQCWHIPKTPTDRAAYHSKSDSFGGVKANPNLRVIYKCVPLESLRWDRSGLPHIRAKSAILSGELHVSHLAVITCDTQPVFESTGHKNSLEMLNQQQPQISKRNRIRSTWLQLCGSVAEKAGTACLLLMFLFFFFRWAALFFSH